MRQKQVDKSHYAFARYLDKRRWISMWHQVDEVLALEPRSVLEIGPGPGIFKAVMGTLGVTVETLDVDPDLDPDHVASVTDMPFAQDAYEVVCAFQMLEHLPFDESLVAFGEMARVARRAVVISLPDAKSCWPISMGTKQFLVTKPRFRLRRHRFRGEHYWDVNKREYPLARVTDALVNVAPIELTKTFRVPEYPYHRFFVFQLSP